MKLLRFGPQRQLGDHLELLEEVANDLTGVVALAEPFELRQNPRQRFFGLGDRQFRVILALTQQTLVMFSKFLAIEIDEAAAR